MSIRTKVVKALQMALACLLLAVVATAGETAPAGKPHMMYFYNPSCRLCTKTNEIVGTAETKYGGSMTHQRFNISDTETGTDNVLYLFALLDEMMVPQDDNVTLAVFLGLLTEENGEEFFTPTRVLVEGDNIIPKLDAEITDFLAKEGKGGIALGVSRQATFFFAHSSSLRTSGT